jgi:hypothetical protein
MGDAGMGPRRNGIPGLKDKDLCMIPWRVALALQADGWWLRSVICWHKKSCMPESVTDRPTNSWEPIFLLAKSQRYFYDNEAVKEPSETFDWESRKDRGSDKSFPTGERNGMRPNNIVGNMSERGVTRTTEGLNLKTQEEKTSAMRNQRNVWTLGPEPYSEAHFATFPTELPRRAILAGTSARGCCPKCFAPWERVVENKPMVIKRSGRREEMGHDGGTCPSGTMVSPSETRTVGWQQGCDCGDAEIFDGTKPVPCTVIDPFGGSGTTGAVAIELGRHAILCELNDAYLPMIDKRTNVTRGLALA